MEETLLPPEVFTPIVVEDTKPSYDAVSLYEEFTKEYKEFAEKNVMTPARALVTLIRNGVNSQSLPENGSIQNPTLDILDLTTDFSKLHVEEDNPCTICCENEPSRSLICCHSSCIVCWKRYVVSEISNGTVLINCLGAVGSVRCSYYLTIEQVMIALDGDKLNFDKYKNLLLNDFAIRSQNIDICPKCHNYVKTTPGVLNVRCECLHWFCPKCKAAPHEPVRCDLVDTLLKGDNKSFKDDLETLQYIVRQTKYCPVCKTPVQKTEGCNFMQCTCNAFFCFNCLRRLQKNHESHNCVTANGHIAQHDLEVLTKKDFDAEKIKQTREKFIASNAEVKTILSNEARLVMIDEKLRKLYDSNITKEEADLLRKCFWVQVDLFSFLSYANLWIDHISKQKDLDQHYISVCTEVFAGVKKSFEDILDNVSVSRNWVPEVRDKTSLLNNHLNNLRTYFKDIPETSPPIS